MLKMPKNRSLQFTRAIRKTALSALSAAAQLLLLISRRSLRVFLQTNFHAGMKFARQNTRVNCKLKKYRKFAIFLLTKDILMVK